MKKLVFTIAMLVSMVTFGQQLHFKSGAIRADANIGKIDNFSQWTNTQFENKSYCIIQFDHATSLLERQKISEATGIQFFDYQPRWAFLASIPLNCAINKLDKYGIRAVVPYAGEVKLNPKLNNRPFPTWMQKGNKVEVYMLTMDGIPQSKIETLCKLNQVEFISWKNSYTAIVQVTEAQLTNLGQLAWVKYVMQTSAPTVLDNDEGRSDHRINVLDAQYSTGLHFDGKGVGVGEGDDGRIGPHIDFKGRVTHHTGSNGGTHGDHVAGIIAGAGNFDPTTIGNAKGAQLHIYSGYGNLNNAPTDYNTDSIRILSNSLGQGCNDGYDSDAKDADVLINSKFSLMSVHSAGNSGGSSCGGVGQGFFTITGGYKAGKNVIATGNVLKDDALANSSSRGPSEDGRIKPDIVAVGTNVNSTQPDNTYDSFTGTSMACPGAAGTLASLWQAYRVLNGGNDPYSALMKGVLLNTADDLGNRGPDFRFGFGRINARRAYNVISNNQFVIDSVANGVTNTHIITVPVGTQQLKAMLYWHDIDGNPASSIVLVNDLNLRVVDPNFVTFNPWVLNNAPNVTALNTPAVRANDSINNVEQVTIDSLVPGNYELRVTGFDIPSGLQKYVVSYEFISDALTMTYPQGGESFVPGVTERVRWDAYNNNLGNFTLEYSDNGGGSWNMISNSISGDRRYYDWTPPNVKTGQMLMRVSRGAIQDVSDTAFTVMPVPTNLMLDTACATTFHLVWDSVAGATDYTIYMLGAQYMTPIGNSSTADYYVTAGVNTTDTFYFAVAANVIYNGAKGRRCIAYTKLPGEVNCLDDAASAETILPFDELYNCAIGSTMPIKMKIKNVGFRNISNIPVSYRINANIPVTELYPGPLNIGDSVIFTFSTLANFGTAGVYNVKTYTSLSSDVSLLNDTSFSTANVMATVPMAAPSVQDFEGAIYPPNGWKVYDYDNSVKWQKTFCLSGAVPGNTNAAYMDFYNYAAKNQIDELETAHIDLTSVTADSVIMTFDVAHAYGPNDLDTLSMWVSDDCAVSFVPTSYKKWGADLATVGLMNTIFSPSTTNQWRNDRLDLTAWKTKQIFVRFRGSNNRGNNLYIDNVNITTKNAWPLGVEGFDEAHIQVYPNPSDGRYNIEIYATTDKIVKWSVYNLAGQLIKNNQLNVTVGSTRGTINIEEMPAGIYLLELNDGSNTHRVKLNKF